MHETYYKKVIIIKPKEMCILHALPDDQSIILDTNILNKSSPVLYDCPVTITNRPIVQPTTFIICNIYCLENGTPTSPDPKQRVAQGKQLKRTRVLLQQ